MAKVSKTANTGKKTIHLTILCFFALNNVRSRKVNVELLLYQNFLKFAPPFLATYWQKVSFLRM